MTNEKKKLAKAPEMNRKQNLGTYAVERACFGNCICYCMSPGMGWDQEYARPSGTSYNGMRTAS